MSLNKSCTRLFMQVEIVVKIVVEKLSEKIYDPLSAIL